MGTAVLIAAMVAVFLILEAGRPAMEPQLLGLSADGGRGTGLAEVAIMMAGVARR